ncbi:methyltransferase domain-containing protein [Desulfovibrio inopinatus]|uniref:methyltransferase domain-containing protein n=1 Tax=Desulfovibrio inopinatus TaxID=102109 RepID=UPI00040AD6E8|nr:methyltransferase domain-containing protein [Desulfovibrio inopinatus]
MQSPKTDFSFVETSMMQRVVFGAILESVRQNIFDTLDNGPLTAAQVAEMHDFQTNETEALLDILTGKGLLEQGPDGYSNTMTASEHLVSTSPFYQGKALELHARFNETVQHNLLRMLQGKSQIREDVDEGWGLEDNMIGTLQHAHMGALQDTIAFISRLPGLDQSGRICDIGGNHGEFSLSLLERYPAMKGDLLDLDHVAKAAEKRIADRGLSQRLSAIPFDLRKNHLRENHYDLILTSHILYAFINELEQFAHIFHAALKPGGWFVSHHLNPSGDLDKNYVIAVQFITRMAGYSTHFIEGSQLKNALNAAGFSNILSSPAGKRRSGLLIAAQKAPVPS